MPIKKTLRTPTPVHIWTDDIERGAEEQLKRLAALPILFHHVAVMPDVHLGRGSTIGAVIATKGAIIPAAVGVDIGCGMVAARTNIAATQLEHKLPELRRRIERAIPVGFDGNNDAPAPIAALDLWNHWDELSPKVSNDARLRKKALLQCGSLGGGNHFIEVCLDREQTVWIMIHSGSRHIGKVLADVHINAAKGLMREAMIRLPDSDLSYLSQGTPEFKSYIHDLLWAQNYAFNNREEMIRRLYGLFGDLFGEEFKVLQQVNCHHNYTQEEEHFGQTVWVTRKGAVSAKAGEWGIIPGSMGAKSFIVVGRGNPDSFNSCSHGAGRRMSRTQAKKVFSVKDLEEQTLGVECRKDQGVLDEIPSAYKDIDQVIKNQADLVDVKATLKQVLCVKG
ncbi:MAG: RtcB family protein [Elusimicrobia bacterium]|nr:RtcB family protein [Candidatus Obscuribacterium magneticum]